MNLEDVASLKDGVEMFVFATGLQYSITSMAYRTELSNKYYCNLTKQTPKYLNNDSNLA